jgi:hypothetical protein
MALSLSDIGIDVGMDISGIKAGVADIQRAFHEVETGGQNMAQSIARSAGLIVAAVVAIASAVAGAAIGSALDWGTQLGNLHDLLGVNARDAAGFAVAAEHVGLGVGDATQGLTFFVRSLGESQDQLRQAAADYKDATASITSDHRDAMARIGEDWARTQADSAAQIAQIWQDLRDTQAEIAAGLDEQIAEIEANLADRIQEIRTNLAEQLQRIDEARAERMAEFAREEEKINRDTAKALADLNREQAEAGIPERFRRAADAAARRREILERAEERKKELSEQRAQAERQFAMQKALAERTAAQQIAAAEQAAAKQEAAAQKAADKQIAAAEKAAAKQAEIAEKQLAAQERLFARREADENKSYQKSLDNAKKTFEKAQLANPFLKALDELGIKATDENGKLRPFMELFDEIAVKFSKLPPGIEKSTLALELFGRGGADFIDFLNEVGKSGGFEKFIEQAENLGLALSPEQIEAVQEFKKNFNDLKLSLTGVGVSIVNEVLPFLNDLVKSLKGDVVPVVKSVVDRLSNALKTGGASGFFQELGKIAGEGLDAFAKEILPKLSQAGADFVGGLFDALTKAAPGASSRLSGVVDTINAWAQSADTQARLAELGKSLGTALGSGLRQLIEDPQTALQFVSSVIGFLANVRDRLNTAAARVTADIATGFVIGIIQGLSGKEITQTMKDAINNFMQTVVNVLFSGGPVAWATSFANGTWSNFVSEFQKVRWSDLGAEIINGLIQGLYAKLSELWSAIGYVAQSALDYAKGILGIQSPSKAFAGVGRQVVEGFREGLRIDGGLSAALRTEMSQLGLDRTRLAPQLAVASAGIPSGDNIHIEQNNHFAAGMNWLDQRALKQLMKDAAFEAYAELEQRKRQKGRNLT